MPIIHLLEPLLLQNLIHFLPFHFPLLLRTQLLIHLQVLWLGQNRLNLAIGLAHPLQYGGLASQYFTTLILKQLVHIMLMGSFLLFLFFLLSFPFFPLALHVNLFNFIEDLQSEHCENKENLD